MNFIVDAQLPRGLCGVLYSHILYGRPYKLLLIRTGNIGVRDLCELVKRQLPAIVAALEDHNPVELYRSTVHVP